MKRDTTDDTKGVEAAIDAATTAHVVYGGWAGFLACTAATGSNAPPGS